MKLTKTVKTTILASLVSAFAVCTQAQLGWAEEKTVDKAAVQAKELMYTIVDKSHYVVSFKKGSSSLDQSSINSLKALFQSLEKELPGSEIVIGAWSDRDFPLDSNVKLPAGDAKLAKARANAVEKAVKSLGVKNKVEVVNFGEQNGFLSNIFKLGSDAPEVKDAIQNGNTDSRKVAAVAKRMQDQGGASKSVVLVRREAEPIR